MWKCFYINSMASLKFQICTLNFQKLLWCQSREYIFCFSYLLFLFWKRGQRRLKMHTFLKILILFLILDLHIWNFQIRCTIHFSINLRSLFTILGISVNYQTKFLQVSDMVPDFQEWIYRGVTLIVIVLAFDLASR